jgi:D-beta-D-heptose 7-phosphate kinase/D-beta-D-heptose 1-phosphate adenosyltransferase
MQRQEPFKILLIGETCEDIYLYGQVNRISPEAPVPVVEYCHEESFSGMASNVKKNLQAFGCFVNLITNKEEIKKVRVVDQESNHQLLRIDHDTKVSPIKNVEVRAAFLHYAYDAIVISDYNKGFLSIDDLKLISQNFNGPVFIDTKKKDLYTESNTYFKINQKEFDSLKNKPDDSQLIVTLGSQGAMHDNNVYPSQSVNVYDVVGAGDAFLSGLVYGYLMFNDMGSAISLANKVASIVVQQPGTYSLTSDDVRSLV